jgi:hypothetical protein
LVPSNFIISAVPIAAIANQITLGKGAAAHKMAARAKQPQLSIFYATCGMGDFRPSFVQKPLDVVRCEK